MRVVDASILPGWSRKDANKAGKSDVNRGFLDNIRRSAWKRRKRNPSNL